MLSYASDSYAQQALKAHLGTIGRINLTRCTELQIKSLFYNLTEAYAGDEGTNSVRVFIPAERNALVKSKYRGAVSWVYGWVVFTDLKIWRSIKCNLLIADSLYLLYTEKY